MQNLNKNVLTGVVVILALGASLWWFTQSTPHPLAISEGDTIASWDWQGTYEDGGDLEKRANDQITRLKGLLGGDQSGKNEDPTDYILYVSIANQYELLGDGKAAYEYLGKALNIDSTKTGLAWRNLGSLMEKLGALETARVAFARAVEAQPHGEEYHIARLGFLIKYFAEDNAALEAAFEEAETGLGEDAPQILQLKAQWHEKTGKVEDAISALQEMEKRMGGNDPSARSEIARLRAL